MRLVIDARSYTDVSGYRWNYKIGYLGLWSEADIEDARSRGELLALVDTTAQAPGAAAIIEWAAGAVQNPFTLQSWVRARNESHADAVVRCSAADLPHVLDVLSTDYFRLWLVDDVAGGEPPMVAPKIALPRTVTLLGLAYVAAPQSGGPYSMSVFYDDSWHAPAAAAATPAPSVPEADRPGELAEQSPMANPPLETQPERNLDVEELSAADPTNPFPGIPVGLPSSTPPDGSAGSDGSSTASQRPVAAAALSTSSVTAPAPRSPDSPSSLSRPVTTGVRLDPAATMTAGPPPAALQVMVPPAGSTQPVKPDTPAPAANPVSSPRLDHAWVSSVMREVLDVADALGAAGAPAAATLLHQAASHGLEVGKLLQMAGL